MFVSLSLNTTKYIMVIWAQFLTHEGQFIKQIAMNCSRLDSLLVLTLMSAAFFFFFFLSKVDKIIYVFHIQDSFVSVFLAVGN